jgi:Flp pilus assembly protein TadG
LGNVKAERDRGAALVEFALILPVFLMLVFGIVEFGRAYNAQIALQGASREGARALALGRTTAQVDATVRAAAPNVTVDRIVRTACTAAGGTATLRAESDFTFSIPLIPIGQRTLHATSAMRCGL